MAKPNQTIRETVSNKILNDILSGNLNPGDKLPSERDFASKYGISRSIVHLAFEELSHAGFIEVRPRSGNYVADFKNNGNFSTLNMLSKVDAGLYQQQYREAMVEVRNILESYAMHLIADRKSEEDFKILDERMASLKETAMKTSDISTIAEELKKYHMEIMKCGANFISTMIMNSFYDTSTRLWEKCVSFWGIDNTISINEKILCFLKEGKGDECVNIINGMYSKYKESNAT